VALDDDEPHDLAACRCRDPRAADTIARARQVLGGILAVRNEPRRHVADVAVGPSDHPDAADSLGVPWRGPADDEGFARAVSMRRHFPSVAQTGRRTISGRGRTEPDAVDTVTHTVAARGTA